MAVGISGKYLGKKKVELLHLDSGVTITTDVPRDNQGEGKSFSPTDLVAAAFCSCVVTTIALVAERAGIVIDGMRFSIERHMNHDSRRIGSMPLELHLPAALLPHERQKLERAAYSCPVHHSLHPEVSAVITFVYDVQST